MEFTNRDVESALRTIFKRCVICPEGQPVCPVCPTGQMCIQTASSCNECASTKCIDEFPDNANSNAGATKESKTNVGAIAGSVVSGVAVVGLLGYLVWRFYLKDKRKRIQEEVWEEQQQELPEEKGSDNFSMRRDARASTHTVASLASTVLTRASNIIQIAYIPGVTNRSDPQSPGILVPPVPPIPIFTTNNSEASTPYSTDDRHFFMPGDLRDSTYSGYTDYSDNRTSIAPSLARSSVATTIYRNNAIVSPMPAQTVLRGKAAVVSVKSNTGSPLDTPNPDTPPVPHIDHAKIAKGPIKIQMPASSDRLTPNGSIRSTATVGKPTPLTITKGKVVPVRTPSNLSYNSSATSDVDTSASEKSSNLDKTKSLISIDSDTDSEPDTEHARSRRSLLPNDFDSNRDSQITDIADTPALGQSPFADMSSSISSPDLSRGLNRKSGLSIVLEGADGDESRRTSRSTAKIEKSPFGDENAVSR